MVHLIYLSLNLMDATEYGNNNMSPLSLPSKSQYLQFLEMLDIHPCTLQTLPSGVVVQPPPPYRHQGFGACSLSSDWPLYFGTNFSWAVGSWFAMVRAVGEQTCQGCSLNFVNGE